MKECFIGVVGCNGSGKSTVCDYLKEQGFYAVSLSDVVRKQAQNQGLPNDRDTLTNLANQLKKAHGLDYFAQETIQWIQQQRHTKVVFDSIRHPKEIQLLLQYHVTFIGVETPLETRYQRILDRKKGTDFVSFDTFKRQDAVETSGTSSGQNIQACLTMCDYKIQNNKDLRNLHEEIDDIIHMIDTETERC
jgi:dephospho-CoA kinase